MTQLSLADLLIHEVPLTPAEAATLTLAVGRELDRARALHGLVGLPDAAAIVLDRRGTVSFLVAPRSCGVDDTAALAGLLSRLLRLDRADRGRQPIPGALLMSIAGRVGDAALPSATPDGFRMALARFADSESVVLPAIFARATEIIGTPRAPSTAELRRHRIARADRRLAGPSAAELRRDLRAVEQRLFEVLHRLGDGDRGSRRAMPSWLTAASVAVLLAIAPLTTLSTVAEPVMPSPRAAAPPQVTDTPGAVSTAPTPVVVVSPEVTTPPARETARPQIVRVTNVRRVAAPARVVHRQRTAAPANTATFAGGTRGISWMLR